jgi:hypothetical protein
VSDADAGAGSSPEAGEAGAEAETGAEPEADGLVDAARARRLFDYAVAAGLFLLALVAVVGLYTAVSSAIATWVTPEFRPLFRAAFNLVVLLGAGAGLAHQARRLT